MAGIGSFAGGFAQGLGNAFDMAERKKRMDREEKEDARKEGLRREASNTIGNIGTDREDGSTYTEDQAYKDYSQRAAQYDPDVAMNARGKGLQIADATRKNDRATAMQTMQDIAMKVQSGAIPEDEGMRLLAGVHSPHPDGRQGFIINVGGQPHAVIGDEKSRTGSAYPITGDGSTFMKAYQRLLSVMDPAYGQKQEELGLKAREVTAGETRAGAATTTANAAARNAETQAGLRGAHEKVYGAMAQYYRDGARGARAGNEQMVNFADTQGNIHPYSFNRGNRSFSALELPAGMHLPTQRAGWQAVQGNPGLFSDGQGFAVFDERSRSFMPVAAPGGSLIDRLKASRSPADGRPSIGVPSPDFHRTSGGRNPVQRFLGLNARPDLTQGAQLYKDPTDGQMIDADTWYRKFGEDPPQ